MTCPDCHQKLLFKRLQERHGLVRREYTGCLCRPDGERISFERLVEKTAAYSENFRPHLDSKSR
jgi:hypothetical protein